jgi:hypothetical protein
MTHDELLYYMNGDVYAASLCNSLIFVGHLWDDQIDKDKIRTNDEVNQAWTFALLDMNDNPFFQAYAGELQPIMRSAIIHWLSANELEIDAEQNVKCMAYLLRNDLLDILDYCIFLTHNRDMRTTVPLCVQLRKMLSKDFQSLFSFFLREMQEGTTE